MLISKTVSVTIIGRNKEFYKKLGYEIPEKFLKSDWSYTTPRGTKIEVKVSDLQAGSGALVKIKCDFCGKIIEKRYFKYISSLEGGDACENCKSEKTKKALIQKYGVENPSIVPGSRAKTAIKRRNSFANVEITFAEHGYRLLSTEYINAVMPLQYICLKHPEEVREIRFSDLKNGHGCIRCGKPRGGECHKWKGGVSSLQDYLRAVIKKPTLQKLIKANHICELTGKKFRNLELHHIDGFSDLLYNTLTALCLPPLSVGSYTQEELKQITDYFLILHEQSQCIVLGKGIHKKFHDIYGYTNFTSVDFAKFASLAHQGDVND